MTKLLFCFSAQCLPSHSAFDKFDAMLSEVAPPWYAQLAVLQDALRLHRLHLICLVERHGGLGACALASSVVSCGLWLADSHIVI